MENFFFMGKKEKQVVVNWIKNVRGKTEKQKEFIADIHRALYVIGYDYYILMREIPYDVEGHVITHTTCEEWDFIAREYCGQDGMLTRLANKSELFLWYAFRIAIDLWTLEEVCDKKIVYDTRYILNPRKSGETYCGGFSDGIGNTPKLIKDNDEFIILGALYLKNGGTTAIDELVIKSEKSSLFCAGVVVAVEE